jgi:hypothetical protein
MAVVERKNITSLFFFRTDLERIELFESELGSVASNYEACSLDSSVLIEKIRG